MPQQRRMIRDSAQSGKLLALFPLVIVFAAITFLALGAKMKASDRAIVAVAQLTPNGDADAQAAEEAAEVAAAAAVVAISLARVAPALPEEALEPPKAKPQPPTPEAQQKPAAPRRDANAQPSKQRAVEPAQVAIAPAQSANAPEQGAEPTAETKSEVGILARIGSYAPSPRKIVSAVSDGVSKLASYIPGL